MNATWKIPLPPISTFTQYLSRAKSCLWVFTVRGQRVPGKETLIPTVTPCFLCPSQPKSHDSKEERGGRRRSEGEAAKVANWQLCWFARGDCTGGAGSFWVSFGRTSDPIWGQPRVIIRDVLTICLPLYTEACQQLTHIKWKVGDRKLPSDFTVGWITMLAISRNYTCGLRASYM